MELKPGYKRTEVGVIPEEWRDGTIADLEPYVTSGSRGWAEYYSDRGSAFLRITNLSRESIDLDLSDLKLVDLPPDDKEGLRTQLADGDLLISITADIGIVGHVGPRVPKPAYINQHIALIRFDESKADSKYLAYFLASERSQKWFRATTDQGAKAGMNLAGIRSIRVAFPSTDEQRAIATALSDADALLTQLDRLIAKKRDIKQAVMQQLLTGKTRLPGFGGEWRSGTVGDVVEALEAGVSVNSMDDPPTPGAPSVLKTSAVSEGRFVSEECKCITPADVPRARINPLADTILISRMNTPDLVGDVAYVAADYPWLFLPDRLWMTRFKSGARIEARWLAYLLSSRAYQQQIKSAATGTSGSMKNISKDSLLSIPVLFPEHEEQTAIATLLSDLDAELAALEARRDKTRALKQGMMQALLTGKTRLA